MAGGGNSQQAVTAYNTGGRPPPRPPAVAMGPSNMAMGGGAMPGAPAFGGASNMHMGGAGNMGPNNIGVGGTQANPGMMQNTGMVQGNGQPAATGGGMVGPSGPNVFSNAATGLQNAQSATTSALGYQAPTLAGTNYQPYQNPYQQQVIDRSLNTLDRSRQMALNNVGANAGGVGAFGGARHGIAEAETNRAFFDQAGDMAANLNMQGFNNAQNAAQFDIGNNMQSQNMQLGAANQLGNLSNLGFGMGQQVNQNLSQQGAQQQALMQALMNAARGQFQGWSGAPGQSLQYPLAAIGGVPQPQSQTTQQNPGLFNMLSLGLGLL